MCTSHLLQGPPSTGDQKFIISESVDSTKVIIVEITSIARSKQIVLRQKSITSLDDKDTG